MVDASLLTPFEPAEPSVSGMPTVAGIISWAGRFRAGLASPAPGGSVRPTRRTASTRPIVVLVLCAAFLIALVVGVIALILSNLRHHAI